MVLIDIFYIVASIMKLDQCLCARVNKDMQGLCLLDAAIRCRSHSQTFSLERYLQSKSFRSLRILKKNSKLSENEISITTTFLII